MNSLLEEMLKKYKTDNLEEKKNAIKEIMQETVLCGLSRGGFFKKAAFYGGTALRIFYGLDRFSEDLDFSLMSPDPDFDLSAFFPALEKEVASYGLKLTVSEKEKVMDSNIRSAFMKGNTKEHVLHFFAGDRLSQNIADNESIKIKFEVDINPPDGATFERKYRLAPTPYEVNLFDMPSLFAGKVHAVICRAWKTRVKGRDLYDYIFYLSHNTKLNLDHLKERLIQSGRINRTQTLTIDTVKQMLYDRFDSIDYNQAKSDVKSFLKDTKSLDLWSSDFFKQITENLMCR